MALGLALVLLLVAIPLQYLGYATTCTQGTDSSFVTGAILSALPLSLSAVLVLFSALRGPREWKIGMLLIVLTVTLLAMTYSIWVDTSLVGTPCGPDFAGYGWGNPTGNFVILTGYLGLPLFMLFSSALLVYRSKRPEG